MFASNDYEATITVNTAAVKIPVKPAIAKI
jgi:hypothetical protein